DPEVYRLGYGDEAGLKVLAAVTTELGAALRRQPGIRIGVVIADSQVVIYSPTPKLIEAGPNTEGAANAIRLATTPPSIAMGLGIGRPPFDTPVVGRESLSLQ